MRWVSCLLGVVLFASTAFGALPDSFSGEGLTVRFTSKSPDDTRGTLELGGNTYPFTAARSGDAKMDGTFTAGGKAYKFTLSADGPGAILETEGTKYRLAAGGQPGPAPQPQPQPAPGGKNPNLTYAPDKIVDPKTKLTVGYLLVPQGWKINPDVLWRPLDAQFVSLRSAIYDPVNLWAVQWIPHDQFSFAPELYDNAIRQGGQPRSIGGIEYTKQLPNALQYLQTIVVPRYRNIQGIKVVGGQELPDLAKIVDQSQPQLRQIYATGGRELQYTAARLRIEYTGPKDVPMEEDILCVLNTSWSPQMVAAARQVGMSGEHFFMPDRLYSFTAPKGQLDAAIPYMQTIVLSFRPDQTWMKFIDNIQGSVTAITNDQYKMEEAARRQITESQKKTVEAAWKSADQQSREVGALLSGTQARQSPFNPNGPPTAAPAGKKSWTNPRGEWKHLDPNEDPNTMPGSTKDWVEAKNASN